jgi:hypothetical protein
LDTPAIRALNATSLSYGSILTQLSRRSRIGPLSVVSLQRTNDRPEQRTLCRQGDVVAALLTLTLNCLLSHLSFLHAKVAIPPTRYGSSHPRCPGRTSRP